MITAIRETRGQIRIHIHTKIQTQKTKQKSKTKTDRETKDKRKEEKKERKIGGGKPLKRGVGKGLGSQRRVGTEEGRTSYQ